MRVSSLTFTNNYLPQLNQLQQSQNQLESEASSGLSMTLPEDNPAMMGQVLQLQADSTSDTQYQSNITQLQSSASNVSNVLTSLQSLLSQANDVALGVGGATSPADMTNDATVVSGYLQNAINLGNTKDANNNYIFGGSATGSPPFTAVKDAAGNITGVTYNGNTNVVNGQIAPNVTVTTQIPGANTTGTGASGLFVDSSSGADIFSHLISLQNDLASGNSTAVTKTDVPNLQTDSDHVINQISANSVTQSTLESASSQTTDEGTNISTQMSNDTSANLSETLTKLSNTQTAYQAALESGVLVMNLSILPYLQ